MTTVSVVLSGSGYLDGAEIRESVGVLWALSKRGVAVEMFAPDAHQPVVMNHLTQKANSDTRNMLVEAARIARGKIKPLSELPDHDYEALIMPGGFGVAKNLCTFGTEGAKGKILYPELERDLKSMYQSGRPIGAICIAPVLVALALKAEKLELTVGAEGPEAEEIAKLGHTHIVTKPNEIHIDAAHKIVTTPAYMYDDAPVHEVFEGIDKLVESVLSMI